MLEQAMKELMKEKSFLDISVQDITARAGINRATFYAHFLDKYDLVNSTIRDEFQAQLDETLPAEPTITRANLYRLIRTAHDYLSRFSGNCKTPHLHVEERMMVQQVQIQLYEVILEWLKRSPSSAKSASASPEGTAMLTSWAIFGPILQTSRGKDAITSQALIDQMMTLMESIFKDHFMDEQAESA